MKRVLIIFCLLGFPLLVNAQNMLAFHVVGNVKYKKGNAMIPLVPNTLIPSGTIINIPVNSKVEFLDETNLKRIIISKPGSGVLSAMMKDNKNTVSTLAKRYITYVKNQLTKIQSKQCYTDFATVTRQGVLLNENDSSRLILNNSQPVETFRDKCNKQYSFFCQQAWKEYEGFTSVTSEKGSSYIVFEDGKDITRPQPVENIKEYVPNTLKMRMEKLYDELPITFYGTELTVRIGEEQRFYLGRITPCRVADAWGYLSSRMFDNLLYDCLKIRKDKNLSDWAYLMLVNNVSDQFCGTGTNETALLCGWLYCQSGYKIRYAYDMDNHLYLFVATKCNVNDNQYYFYIDGTWYFSLRNTPKKLWFIQAAYEKECIMSLSSEDKLYPNIEN